ncbi:MAG: hypothetical protein KGH88_08930 [Thaumarchaeota archaeon]|nr:hypothetical protein [Nitrososphaerota archaeon]
MAWEPNPIKIPVSNNPVEEGKSFLDRMEMQANAISFCREYSRQQLRRIQRLKMRYGNRLGRHVN